jgi:hypothetical protein
VTQITFGEADPRDFAPAESAPQQTNAPITRPVALRATLELRLLRYPRKRCDSCGIRRVRFAIAANGQPLTGLICAHCAGVR